MPSSARCPKRTYTLLPGERRSIPKHAAPILKHRPIGRVRRIGPILRLVRRFEKTESGGEEILPGPCAWTYFFAEKNRFQMIVNAGPSKSSFCSLNQL